MSDTMTKEVQALSKIMDRPNLVGLSYGLRHPETWPADFVWNYSDCRTCGIGLALRLWPQMKMPSGPNQEEAQRAKETWIAREMAMSHREAKNIFFGLYSGAKEVEAGVGFWGRKTRMVKDFSGVTADDVADAIDKYLAANG